VRAAEAVGSGRRVLVLHGPNLNRLGVREPALYGRETLAELDSRLVALGRELGAEVECRQSNHEGELVGWLQEAESFDAVLLNPAAYTHTSVAVRDAIAGLARPVFEVHISNVHRREPFRHVSLCAEVVVGRIMGFGTEGYALALRGALAHLERVSAGEPASGE
jgi:3-dehydroquinate dehydratase II